MNKGLKNIFRNIGEYTLDEENVLLVFDNSKNAKSTEEKYCVIHYRNGVEVNRWFQKWLWHNKKPLVFNHTVLIPSKRILLREPHNGLYDFQKGEFVAKIGDWDNIVWDEYNLLKNDCFIAWVILYSPSDKEHVFDYYDPFAHKQREYSFTVGNKIHFAILNIDGTIRDNKIFIGFDKEHIEKVVDFSKYSSLEDYKTRIIPELEEEMRKKEEEFYQALENKKREYYQSLQSLGESYEMNNDCGQEFTRTLSKNVEPKI